MCLSLINLILRDRELIVGGIILVPKDGDKDEPTKPKLSIVKDD